MEIKWQLVFSSNKNFNNLWNYLYENDDTQYPLYTSLGIEYQKEYLEGVNFKDLSFIIDYNDVPIIGIILSLNEIENGSYELSSYGRPIFYLENKNIDLEFYKAAQKKFKKQFSEYISKYDIKRFKYHDFLINGQVSFFGNILLNQGVKISTGFYQIIDLSLSSELLYSMVRQSYKNLINWGKNNLSIKIVTNKNKKEDYIHDFKDLHRKVSGKITRNDNTWSLQYKMVEKDEAFLVLGYLNNNLVTAALFISTNNYCYYGVSASDRKKINKPMSHAIIWEAISHAKSLGIKYFELGEQLFKNESKELKPINNKELGISKFKKGFGGYTKVRLELSL